MMMSENEKTKLINNKIEEYVKNHSEIPMIENDYIYTLVKEEDGFKVFMNYKEIELNTINSFDELNNEIDEINRNSSKMVKGLFGN